MYLNALESQSIPDTDTLSLIYLPNQAHSTVRSLAIEVTAQNQSPVEVTQSPSEANNSDTHRYVTYCHLCANQRLIGCRNKGFFCSVVGKI